MTSARRLRVLFVIDSSSIGGAERVVCSIVRRLAAGRCECYVICPAGGPMVERYARVARGVAAVPHRSLLHPAAIRRIARCIQRWQIDVVQTCLYTSDVAGLLAAKLARRGRVVSHVVGNNFTVTEERGIRRLRKRCLSYGHRLIYRWADRVVAVSEAVKDDLSHRPGIKVPAAAIVVIPHALPEDVTVSAEAVARVRRLLGLADGATVIATVGSLIPVKGHRYLFDGLARVVERRPEVTCVLVGQGPSRRPLERLAERLGLNGRVVFAGALPDELKNAVMALSRLVVLPSLSEGLPVSVLEAMALAKPVVATDAGGTRELVVDGVTGRLIPPANPEALAEAVRGLLSDQPLAERMGLAARRRLDTWPSWDEVAARLETVYVA